MKKNFSVKYRAEISHLIEAVENPKQTQLTTILDIEYRLANLKLVSSLFSWIAQYKNFLAGGFHLFIITLFFSVNIDLCHASSSAPLSSQVS